MSQVRLKNKIKTRCLYRQRRLEFGRGAEGMGGGIAQKLMEGGFFSRDASGWKMGINF